MSLAAPQKVIVIGHRGASGYRPEHTLESYELAIKMGVDFIEPDLVITKDKVLIARHENEISATTDVAHVFPDRKRTKTIDGVRREGWFAEDFTLAEIKQLRARERLRTRDQTYNGRYQIPTFAEVLELAQKRGRELNRTIGVYPETKHPSYFASLQQPLEPQVVAELKRVGWTTKDAPVILQSFELESLRILRKSLNCRLVLLLGEGAAQEVNSIQLRSLSSVLDGIGPAKQLTDRDLVDEAHRAGLVVHVYTFRSDPPFLAEGYQGDPLKEYQEFFAMGVDGVFSDFPDHAIKAREAFSGAQSLRR